MICVEMDPLGVHLDNQQKRNSPNKSHIDVLRKLALQPPPCPCCVLFLQQEKLVSSHIALSNTIRVGINHSSALERRHEHCLAVTDGFKIWLYCFPSFLKTNWTFIAYILKIIQSSREADVSFIEAHREVRSPRINFPVLLLPLEDVWKMPAPLNWFRNEFITWGQFEACILFLCNLRSPVCFCLMSCFAQRFADFSPFCAPWNHVSFIFATKKKMDLIHWVLGGFTNIAIKQSQCFYCALDLEIEPGLTAGSRRNHGKGLVFVCLYGDEWPVSTGWLVCTIKLSKRKDFP